LGQRQHRDKEIDMATESVSGYAEYDNWLADPSPDNMANVVKALDPMLVSEVQRYPGPKDILHSKAKTLAVKAVQTYDPIKGTGLRTWLTTQLQPLTRYSQHIKTVYVPEAVTRQAAELHTITENMHDNLGRMPTDEELADESGLSQAKIQKLRSRVRPAISESQLTAPTAESPAMPALQRENPLVFSSEAVYDGLEAREKAIYDWKTGAHGQPQLSNQEIAARLGVSPGLITQLSQRIATQIQEASRYAV
jgi:RNA polymerase nonessential primary-like sigma factor